MEKAQTEIEFEVVSVRVPKAVMNLLRTFMGDDDLQNYLTYTIVQDVASALSSDCHHGEIVSFEAIMERFNLKPIFEAFDLKRFVRFCVRFLVRALCRFLL